VFVYYTYLYYIYSYIFICIYICICIQITGDLDAVLHCLLDVVTKNCYGFALLFFKTYFDKKLVEAGVNEDDFEVYRYSYVPHDSFVCVT